ncbi:hypothetical protein [Prosthecobacter sp.]|jgi:hypothetical protein|uniref:hypothetical protein n=1 Tax=Prosthecobacter sp. TaxID=1965333 RepID=UPI0037C9E94A
MNVLLNNFNGGEFSPLLFGRTDIAKYKSGCGVMENFIPRVFGGAHSRPGMVFHGKAKSQATNDQTRLIEFEFSETTRMILELGNFYVRFWKDSDPVMHSGDAPVWALTVGWVTATNYVVGNVRAHNGIKYTCTDNHTSDAATEPGVGVDWETKWTAGASFDYQRGDFVLRSGLLFYCILTHIALSATEPQAGGSWQMYWVRQDIYERPTPFSTAQLFDVQYEPLNDWVYLTHPEVYPQKLTRQADNLWTIAPVDYTYPPLGDENVTDTTLAVSNISGTGRTLTASAAVFQAGHVGSHWGLAHRRSSSSIELPLRRTGANFTGSWNANTHDYTVGQEVHWKGAYYTCSTAHTSASTTEPGVGATWATVWTVIAGPFEYTSATLRMVGEWDAFSYENWSGSLFIERSADDGTTWETIRSFSGDNDRNVNPTGQQDTEALFRLRFIDTVIDDTTTPDGRAVLEAVDSKVAGMVRITAVNSPTEAICDVVISPALTDATVYWREGSWSDYRGYPRTVSFFEQRIIYGGSASYPRRVWFSTIGDVDNFRWGTKDDNAFNYLLSGKSNAVQWMAAPTGTSSGIAIGTLGDELMMQAASAQETLTPTSPSVSKQSSRGSAYLPAISADDVILFVQADRRTVREFVFDFSKGGFVSQPMTLLAEHVTKSGIVQMAFQQKPDAIIWCVTTDGRLIAMTYERQQEVVAWHRHPTDGFVESVAVISGIPPGADEVWLSVRRTVDGAPVRYLERFDPEHWNKVEEENKPYFICSDSAKAQDFGEDVTIVDGLDHLEGREVVVLVDGAVHPNRTVTDGQIELQTAGQIVVVGLPFVALIQPNEIELDLPDGSSFSRKRRANRVALQFWKSLGCEVRQNALQWERLEFRDTEMPMDDSPPVFTGQKEIHVEGSHQTNMQIQIRQSQPLPLNLLAVCVKMDFYGD